MARPKLYLDEDIYAAVAVGLKRRGFEVLTTVEAGMMGATDEQQLGFAINEERCLFTFNRGHFAELHAAKLFRGDHHYGIVVSRQANVGPVVHALCALLASYSSDELRDQLLWLAL